MNRIFFLFLFIFIFFSVKSEKLFRLVDLLDKDSYIPIRQGEVFIIEVEGNPSQNRVWSVEDPKTLISRDLIFPLNLDEHDSCTFYISETKSNFAQLDLALSLTHTQSLSLSLWPDAAKTLLLVLNKKSSNKN